MRVTVMELAGLALVADGSCWPLSGQTTGGQVMTLRALRPKPRAEHISILVGDEGRPRLPKRLTASTTLAPVQADDS
jgi:hypothetical protein